MKRFISLMLVVMQLVMLVPAEAQAFEDSYTLSAKEVTTIAGIAGTNSVYREGMNYSPSMSAYQKYCWLEEFCKYDLAAVKNQCGSILLDDGEAAKLPEFKAIYRAVNDLDQLVQYWAADLDQEISAVEAAQTLLKNKENSQGEKAKAYRSLTKARNRIDEIYDEMAEEAPSGFAATTDAWFAALQEIIDHYVTPAPIRTLSADEFHVIILNSNEFGIQLRTEDKEPVSGAKVTLSSGTKTQTLETGTDGTVVFNGGNYELDRYNKMWANLYIEKKGMRIYESHGLLMKGGEGVNVIMEEDDGDPYIQYVTFRNTDILHGTETVYQTKENNANQSFLVGVHIDPGQKASFVMNYTVLNGTGTKNIEREVAVSGAQANAQNVAVLDLTDKWCSFLAPKSKVGMELNVSTGTENKKSFKRDIGISTEEAIVSKPISAPGRMSVPGGIGFSLKIPLTDDKDAVLLKDITINLNFPLDFLGIPFSFVTTPEGDLVFSVAFHAGKNFTDNAKNDKWKTRNCDQKLDDITNFFYGADSWKEMARKKAGGTPTPGFGIFSVSVNTELAGVLSAKLKPGKAVSDPYVGEGDVFVSAAADITLSKSFPFVIPLLGIPCYAGFDFSAGFMIGVDIPFTFTSAYQQAYHIFGWENRSYKSKDLDILFGPRFSINAYAGAGIKGLASLCLKGSVSVAFAGHIYPHRSSDKLFAVSVDFNGSVTLTAEFLLAKATLKIVDKHLSDYAPKDSGPISAGSDLQEEYPIRYVQAEVKDAGTFNEVTNIRTVQSGTSFYSFYVQDTKISGKKRPWLRCSVIADDGTVTELPLPRLGEKALAKIGADTFPEDMYVCAFDAASLKDVYNKENGAEVIALEVIFTTRDNLDLFVESYFLYRLPGGDLQQTGSLLHRGVVQRSETPKEPPLIGHVNVNICPHRGNTTEGVQNFSVMNTFILNDSPMIFDAYQQDFKIDPETQSVAIQSIDNPRASSYQIPGARNYEHVEQLEIVREDPQNAYAFIILKKRKSEEKVLMGLGLNAATIMSPDIITGDIASFKCLPVSSITKNVTIALVHDADKTGRCAFSLAEFFTRQGEKRPTFNVPRQIVTKISPAYFSLVDLGTSLALYYLDTATETSGNMKRSNFEIKAVYFAEGSDGGIFASHSFHLAEFPAGDLKVDNGTSELRISANNKKFMHGTVLESNPSASHSYKVKQFHFEQTLQVDLQGAVTDNAFPKPGETVNLFFPILNTGNVPLSRVLLSAYATRSGSTEHIPLADIEINCVNPEKSSVVNYDLEGEVLSSLEGLRAVSQYNTTIGESMDTFIVGTKASSANAYATNVLMPDEKHVYRSSFTVPKSFKVGDYTIHLTPKEFSTLVKRNTLGVYDATGAWVTTLENMDGSGKVLQSTIDGMPATTLKDLGGNDAPDNEILTLTAYVQDTRSSAGETVPVTLTLTDGNNNPVPIEEESDLLRAFAQSTILDSEEINLDHPDLSINARLSLEAEQEIVHIVIRNETVSPMTGIKLDCDIDGSNCYSVEFGDMQLLYKDTVSIDVPLEKITGGKDGELLNLNIAGKETESILFNNTDSLPLLSDFIITRDPSDQYVLKGARAEFEVRARGGEEPYSYQWQISMDGQDGKYRNIDGATELELIIEKAKLEQNGAYVRCLVRDKTGETLTSKPALLLVKKLPQTGDTNNVGVMLALMLGSAAVIVFLLRRRRHA